MRTGSDLHPEFWTVQSWKIPVMIGVQLTSFRPDSNRSWRKIRGSRHSIADVDIDFPYIYSKRIDGIIGELRDSNVSKWHI